MNRALLETIQTGRRVAEWLPAPQVVPRPRVVAPTKSIWIPLDTGSVAEKALMAGLVAAAAIGIAYGFSCLLNLVQNWAAVNASLRSIIQ